MEKLTVRFAPGGLSSSDLNSIVDKVNELVDAINILQKSGMNVNLELNTPNNAYTLSTARALVPATRRASGFKLIFRQEGGVWTQWVFSGNSTDDLDWNSNNNWVVTLNDRIDGGEW